MIKVFVLIGIVGGLAIGALTLFGLGPVSQLPPSESLLTGFRQEGFVPKSVDLLEDEAVEHDIFGVPPEDEAELAKAVAAMATSGMDMSGGDSTMEMAEGTTMEMAEGGLIFSEDGAFDREIDLKMTEWGFSEMNIGVKKGERIRFNIINDGQILHEFMVMQMVQMQAVAYRVERADWSLLEHEALYEKSLMLPGQKISFVMEVQENGAWMFMCMLPFHMQMGMMGQMATEGSAMEM